MLIHDGARPFVTDEIICSVISALGTHNAVACAVKLKDTVKQVDKNGYVLSTLDRDTLVAVQTPQGVNVSDYRAALEIAGNPGAFTDDMSVMEAAGHKPFTVPGSYENIKVTTPEDIALAEYLILKGMKKNENTVTATMSTALRKNRRLAYRRGGNTSLKRHFWGIRMRMCCCTPFVTLCSVLRHWGI